MSVATPIPGLYYSLVRPRAQPSPIRTDVAGFFGRTKRGPVVAVENGKKLQVTRVEGWREYVSIFGGLINPATACNSVAIAAAPNGATEVANTVTITTQAAHSFQAGDTVRIMDVAVAAYNGLWTVTDVPTATTFTYSNPIAGLADSGGGNVFSPTNEAMTPYAVRGYFENGGQVAHIVRLLKRDPNTGRVEGKIATGSWQVGAFDRVHGLNADWPGDAHFPALSFSIEATSPGDWANGTMVSVRYWAGGSSGKPELELDIRPVDEEAQLFSGIDPEKIVVELNNQSRYIRLTADNLPAGLLPADLNSPNPAARGNTAPRGPRFWEWDPIQLSGGTIAPPTKQDYLDAIEALGDEAEVALVACPDLYPDLPSQADRIDVLSTMLIQADALHDRLVIIDVPGEYADPIKAVNWVDNNLRNPPELQDERRLRNGAVYHPRLQVPDPLGGVSAPLRCVPCSGLVAGVISRLDDQLGAYYTPANAEIDEAVDLSRPLTGEEQATLYAGGINLLKCSPNRGLLVWGGRVLGRTPLGGALAHRRLIHLLVRAIRRVAEPLVFDSNGPQLWLTFTRSITSVLLEAYRAGALKGSRPEEAFRVRCDSTTNPPENIDLGVVICEIEVAPAFPMEFILLRVAASKDGKLEVFES